MSECDVYCDLCGDCIRCFGDDPCPHDVDGEHQYSVPNTDDED